MRQRNISFNFLGKTTQQNSIGVSAATLEAIVKAHGEHSSLQEKEIKRLEAALRLNKQQMGTALEILGESPIEAEQYGPTLIEVAKRIKALHVDVPVASTDNSSVAALKPQVRGAILAADLGRADALLEQLETQQSQELSNALAGASDTLRRRAEIAMARLRYREAAGHFAKAAAILPSDSEHANARLDFLWDEYKALFLQGTEFGDTEALRLAAQRLRTMIAICTRENPEQWGTSHYELGRVLWRLAEREGLAERFKEAATALREALTVRTRERTPREWAWTQNELGNVLRALGSQERNAESLREAAAAYRAAMEIRTRRASPSDWAMGQSNLGAALRSLADIEGDPGLAKEAIAAYQAALGVWTRQSSPANWAMAQSNLGNAYHLLGAQNGDVKAFERAAAAHRLALVAYTRERYPLDWARTKINLASVLKRRGEREAGSARLQEAAGELRAALQVCTPETAPYINRQASSMLLETNQMIAGRAGLDAAKP
jgi:tetratricopeptide (TPR) repeat protein